MGEFSQVAKVTSESGKNNFNPSLPGTSYYGTGEPGKSSGDGLVST